jgi:hypothetical protein
LQEFQTSTHIHPNFHKAHASLRSHPAQTHTHTHTHTHIGNGFACAGLVHPCITHWHQAHLTLNYCKRWQWKQAKQHAASSPHLLQALTTSQLQCGREQLACWVLLTDTPAPTLCGVTGGLSKW